MREMHRKVAEFLAGEVMTSPMDGEVWDAMHRVVAELAFILKEDDPSLNLVEFFHHCMIEV